MPKAHDVVVRLRQTGLVPGSRVHDNEAVGGDVLVYIDKGQLEQIEYLLAQSVQGIHLLFESHELKSILKKPTEDMDFFTFENVNKIRQVLSDFIRQRSFSEKKRFLNSLDKDTYELLVRSYFNIVENTVLETTKMKH